MGSILDFTINYRSDNEQLTPGMFFLSHQVIQNKKLSNFEPQIEKMFNLHFDSHI